MLRHTRIQRRGPSCVQTPTPERAPFVEVGFRNEQIRHFIDCRNSDERFPILINRSSTHRISTIPLDVQAEDLGIYIDMAQRTTSSCIQGWGGQVFVNRRDKSYGEFDEYTANIINNTGCSQPCILNKKSISHCNLNPGPFQRLMCAFVVEAWRVNPLYAQPMQPHEFQITCDGFIMGKVQWRPFRLRSFSQPPPNDTFQATINWVFLQMWHNTIWRTSILPTFLAAKIDCKKSFVLCKKSIIKVFEEIRANQYSLEQICWLLLGGMDEEYFVTCRDHGVRTEDGKCQNAERINRKQSGMHQSETEYESDCLEVRIPQ